jgi:preprotein translocase subunit YajC
MLAVHILVLSSIHTVAPLAGPLLAAAKKNNGSFTLIFFVLLFGVGYMFLIRPQRQRRQRQLQLGKQVSVGDKVMLSSGIIGRVEGFVGDRARIEIAPGTVIEVVRAAVSQRVDETVGGDHDNSGDSSFDERHHEDLVDDAGHDPYSVAPLETGETTDPGDDADGRHPGGNSNGGRGR